MSGNRCNICGSEELAPFTCSYCKNLYCSEHRLPEAHSCPNLWMARARYEGGVRYPFGASGFRPRRSIRAPSLRELRSLLVAWLVLSLAFALRWIFIYPILFPLMLLVSLITAGLGFILHELTHKIVAQRFGYGAEFRVWPWGLGMALILSLLSGGTFIFAAPGVTYISQGRSAFSWSQGVERRDNGVISLAGVLTNIGLALGFLALSRVGGILGLIGSTGFMVNLWLGAFNMIPLFGMDGARVMAWRIPAWAAVALPLWAALAYTMLS